jgi:hypothetical protein
VAEGEDISLFRSPLTSVGNVSAVLSGHLEQRLASRQSVEELRLPPLFNISRSKQAKPRSSKLPKLTAQKEAKKEVGQSNHKQRALGGLWNQSGGWLPMGPS